MDIFKNIHIHIYVYIYIFVYTYKYSTVIEFLEYFHTFSQLFYPVSPDPSWLPRLLSGDLPLTLLELGSLGGLVAAAWLLPSETVDVNGSWSLKELAGFLCTKDPGPLQLAMFSGIF